MSCVCLLSTEVTGRIARLPSIYLTLGSELWFPCLWNKHFNLWEISLPSWVLSHVFLWRCLVCMLIPPHLCTCLFTYSLWWFWDRVFLPSSSWPPLCQSSCISLCQASKHTPPHMTSTFINKHIVEKKKSLSNFPLFYISGDLKFFLCQLSKQHYKVEIPLG